MPHRVHAGVETMQSVAAQSQFDRLAPNAERLELPPRHHSMLPPSKLRYPPVQSMRLL